MTEPIVFGALYSVYTRIVRMALEEKAVAYRLREIDIFADGGPGPEYVERHPFHRIPAFEHDGFRLYETGAISRYIDDVFPEPPLMPERPPERARVNQIIGVLDSYAYRTWVWDIFVERVRIPQKGGRADKKKVAAAVPRADTCLSAIERLMQGDGFFLGNVPTLADLHAAPMLALLRLTPEGERLLSKHSRWRQWWLKMNARPSMIATRFAVEG